MADKRKHHWRDCAINHGGKECDMGPSCGCTCLYSGGEIWAVQDNCPIHWPAPKAPPEKK